VDLVVNLNGDADGIATSDTKASREDDLVLQSVGFDCFVHQFDDTVGAFDMASTSNTYLNNHLMTIPFCRVSGPDVCKTPI
jgi:hypothetical protein